MQRYIFLLTYFALALKWSRLKRNCKKGVGFLNFIGVYLYKYVEKRT